MKKSVFIPIIVLLFAIVNVKSLMAAETYRQNYYPYTPRWADIYVGLEIDSLADQTISQPVWGGLYYPPQMMRAGGFGVVAGIRPLGIVPLIRNFRFEVESSYQYSNYDILHNATTGSWITSKDLPSTYGKVYMKESKIVNAYYDIRWFSDTFYPFIGIGMGDAGVGVKYLDTHMLVNGVGPEFTGYNKNVLVKQFMVGFEYDTKIIKTSFFFEYRYLMSDPITAYPHFVGNEPLNDSGVPENKPAAGFVPEPATKFSLKMQMLVVGIKYYLY